MTWVGLRLFGQPSDFGLWWRTGLRTYVKVMLPMLVVAAIVEVTVTSLLAHRSM